METSYKYSFGRIEQIINGELDKVDSLDELDYSPDSGLIIVPKVIGVYQEDEHLIANPFLESLEKYTIFINTGERENILFGLISLIYDPTIISNEVLVSFVKGDSLKRLKYLKYCEDLPNFSEKQVPDIKIIKETFFNPSSENVTILKRAIEYFKLAREDFGLTRLEAIMLEASQCLIGKIEGENSLITDPLSIKLESRFLNFFKDTGFDDLFRGKK